MTFLRTSLAAGLIFGGIFAGAAQAAPAPVQLGLTQDGLVETVAMRHHHHHRMHRHHTTRHERRMRRMNTMRHGNPNARNPSQPGPAQQLGNTTNGPRY